MELIVKQEPSSLEAFDYKHKKFDVGSKRIRYDSNSSTEYSSASSLGPTINEVTTRNSDTPLSIISDYHNFQPGHSKRSCASFTSDALSQQPTLKRRRLLKQETNDSGFFMTTQQTDDDLRLTPAPPRYTSTPLSVLANVAAATTPLKRSHKHIFESNDSGLSMTPHKYSDDAHTITTPRMQNCPRYTSTPLAVLAAVAATTPTPLPAPPTAVIMPKISDETMHNICKYHGNMVRKFPKKERTPKDQERRNKNTIACRMSRRLKKLENVAVEEQNKEFTKQHLEIVEASIRSAAYLNALTMKLAAINGGMMGSTSERPVMKIETKPSASMTGRRQPKPFSIEYLTGKTSSS